MQWWFKYKFKQELTVLLRSKLRHGRSEGKKVDKPVVNQRKLEFTSKITRTSW